MMPIEHSYDILLKKVAAFYLVCMDLAEVVENFELITLSEEISKEPSIDSVMCILVVTLMKIYSEK